MHSGPFNIILPGGFARVTQGTLAVQLPKPAVVLAGFTGTVSTFAIRLPGPHAALAGKDVHDPLHLALPSLQVTLTGKAVHSAVRIVLPALHAQLAAQRAHAGNFHIQLGQHRSVRPPARHEIAPVPVPEPAPGPGTIIASVAKPPRKPGGVS